MARADWTSGADRAVHRVRGRRLPIGWSDRLASHAYAGDDPYIHGTGFHHIFLRVRDLRAMITRLEAMEVEVTVPPNRYLDHGPRIAYVKDPDGHSVEFLQPRAD